MSVRRTAAVALASAPAAAGCGELSAVLSAALLLRTLDAGAAGLLHRMRPPAALAVNYHHD